jgi:hypothetical protein
MSTSARLCFTSVHRGITRHLAGSFDARSREMFPECIPVATLDRVIVPKLGGKMPREFTSRKAIRNHAELTGYVYLWEGTHAFTTRRLLLSPDQYEIVDVRTDHGMRRAMLFPKEILKAEWDAAAPLRDALIIRRERWRSAPQRVKPIHSGVPYVQLSRYTVPTLGIHDNYVLPYASQHL